MLLIIFEIGAFDRFVYIHGHTSSEISSWSKWCRRISTKSGSIILLILPILCSLPIAICNLLHAHVLYTSLKMKICIVQYTHKILISFLIFFYVLPLLFSFFLHAKLIYFIRSKHHQHYLTTASYIIPMKRTNIPDSKIIIQNQRRIPNQSILKHNQQLLQPKIVNNKNRRIVMFNTDTIRNTPGTIMTTTTIAAAAAAAGQQVATNNSSNSSGSSRSSNGASFTSMTSPIIQYKINSQANANAKRTVLLLVLLLSFYVLCWAPYNIYTWNHAYQLTTNKQNDSLINRALLFDFNQTLISLTDNLHSDLRRIIFINYSLYLLSMISMCFSFIFYFSLNKQARQELTSIFGCICPWFIDIRSRTQTKTNNSKQKYEEPKALKYHTRYRHHYPHNINDQRVKTMNFKTHRTFIPPTPLLVNQQKIDNPSLKRTKHKYGCHIECCP